MNYEDIKEKSNYDINKVKSIIENIELRIKNSIGALHTAIENDNKSMGESYSVSNILSAIDRAKKEPWIMEENSKNHINYGLGKIGVVSSSNPEVVTYLVIKALKTGNDMNFYFEDISESSEYLIKLAIEECEKIKYNTVLEITNYDNTNEIFENWSASSLLLFINQKSEYLNFIAKNVNDVKTIYSSFGTIDLYMEDITLKETLKQIDDYVYNNNIEMDLYQSKDIEKVVNSINEKNTSYCAVIFTKDKEKAVHFIKNVNAEKIYINRNPAAEYYFELSDDKFVNTKNIYL